MNTFRVHYIKNETGNEKEKCRKKRNFMGDSCFWRKSSSNDATRALSFAIHSGGGLFRRNGSLAVEEFQFVFKCFHCLKLLSYLCNLNLRAHRDVYDIINEIRMIRFILRNHNLPNQYIYA